MKIRVKFSKYGNMKFVGHLDIMRYFQKAIRRSGISASFSQGFSPHMIMSFAEPLGVSIMSRGEYFDLECDYEEGKSPGRKNMIEMLQKTMVPGIDIVDITLIGSDKKSKAMSLVAAASYIIYGKNENDELVPVSEMLDMTDTDFNDAVGKFIEQDVITATYRSKKDTKEIDIKERIISLDTDSDGALRLFCHAGSSSNLRPAIVLETLCGYIGKEYDEMDFQIIREDIYALGNNAAGGAGYIPLSDLGTDF